MHLVSIETTPTLYHPISGKLLLKNKKPIAIPAASWTTQGTPTKEINYLIRDPLLKIWWEQHGIHQLNHIQSFQNITLLLANSFLAAAQGHPEFILLQKYSNPKNKQRRKELIKKLQKTKTEETEKKAKILSGNHTFYGHFPEGIPALSHYIVALKCLKTTSSFLAFSPSNPQPTPLIEGKIQIP